MSGFYFVTICTKNREHLFGEIIDDKMLLNDFGIIIKDEWEKTPEFRTNIILGEYTIMPNHFHAIFQIEYKNKISNNNIGKFKSPVQTIGSIIRGFKGVTTLKINKYLPTRNFGRGVLLYAQNRNNSIWQKIIGSTLSEQK